MLVSKVKQLCERIGQISYYNYPEQRGILFIVNAGIMFTLAWPIVKVWIDEYTQKIIHVYGSDFKSALLQHIDEDQLIDFLGGKNKRQLSDNWGPWNDFEVVDGKRKRDRVGIKRKGTWGGPIFTP